jgi:drug/metabolite transporter (DMT)-like permease
MKLIKIFLVGLLYCLFASTIVLSKVALQSMSPLVLVSLRFLIAGAILYAYLFVTRKKPLFTIKKGDLFDFFQVGSFLYLITFVFDNWSLQFISSAESCLMYNLSPFITAIIAYFVWSKRITPLQCFALCVGFLAFVPMLVGQLFDTSITNQSMVFIAEAVLLIAIIANANGWIMFDRLLQKGYDVITINCITMLGSGVAAGVLTVVLHSVGYTQKLVLHDALLAVSTVTGTVWGDFLLLIIIAHVICYNLYGYLLRTYSATFLSFAGFTTPLFTAFLGYIFLQERVDQTFFVTVLLVTVGLYLFYQDE